MAILSCAQGALLSLEVQLLALIAMLWSAHDNKRARVGHVRLYRSHVTYHKELMHTWKWKELKSAKRTTKDPCAILVAMQISVTINQEIVNYWYDRELWHFYGASYMYCLLEWLMAERSLLVIATFGWWDVEALLHTTL